MEARLWYLWHDVSLAVAFGHFLLADVAVPDNYAVAIAALPAHSVIPLASDLSDQFDVRRRRQIDSSVDGVPRSAALLWGDKVRNGDARQH
jgi:hypothetical protein